MIRQNAAQAPAPSIRADSYRSEEMVCSPARMKNTTIEVFFQTSARITMLSARNGEPSHWCGVSDRCSVLSRPFRAPYCPL